MLRARGVSASPRGTGRRGRFGVPGTRRWPYMRLEERGVRSRRTLPLAGWWAAGSLEGLLRGQRAGIKLNPVPPAWTCSSSQLGAGRHRRESAAGCMEDRT